MAIKTTKTETESKEGTCTKGNQESAENIPAIDLSKYSSWELVWDKLFYGGKPLDISPQSENRMSSVSAVIKAPPAGWIDRHRLVHTVKASVPWKGKFSAVFKWKGDEWVLESLCFPDVGDTYGTRNSDEHARLIKVCAEMKAESIPSFAILLLEA